MKMFWELEKMSVYEGLKVEIKNEKAIAQG